MATPHTPLDLQAIKARNQERETLIAIRQDSQFFGLPLEQTQICVEDVIALIDEVESMSGVIHGLNRTVEVLQRERDWHVAAYYNDDRVAAARQIWIAEMAQAIKEGKAMVEGRTIGFTDGQSALDEAMLFNDLLNSNGALRRKIAQMRAALQLGPELAKISEEIGADNVLPHFEEPIKRRDEILKLMEKAQQ